MSSEFVATRDDEDEVEGFKMDPTFTNSRPKWYVSKNPLSLLYQYNNYTAAIN